MARCCGRNAQKYDPQAAGHRLIEKVDQGRCYELNLKGIEDTAVVIPPPNVIGISFVTWVMPWMTYQDTIRYSRMRGYSTRWILELTTQALQPQTKVDKKLKSEGISS